MGRSTGIFKEAVIGVLAAVAKQERVRLSETTIAGLQRAKAQGRVGGRPRTEHDPRKMDKPEGLRQGGASFRRMAKELGLSATTVARLVRDPAKTGSSSPRGQGKLLKTFHGRFTSAPNGHLSG